MSLSAEFFEQFGQNAGFIKEQYELFSRDPGLVDPHWVEFFHKQLGTNGYANGAAILGFTNGHTEAARPFNDLDERTLKLVRSFRERGHLRAQINPLSAGVMALPGSRELQIESYGFSQDAMSTEVRCDRFQGKSAMALSDLIAGLEKTYCSTIGFEFMHLANVEAREFLRERIEARTLREKSISLDEKKRILKKLVQAELMESELHRKYVGQKRFSLQGGDSLIPMLDTLLERCPAHHIRELFIGMPHRGRLNVLANIVGKPLGDIFNEFEDQSIFSVLGSGDVKYHLGYAGTRRTQQGAIVDVQMAPNPSHLEFIDPVLEGIVRARQDIFHGRNRTSVLPVAIHGDAAFIGQGVVYETFNFMSVPGHATGGTVHIVVNNQVGFTTDAEEARSSTYCSDMAKGLDIPVFHVNVEDPEACSWVSELALEFRCKFQRDVILDLYCFRKYGHNEGDDPSFTQPLMYKEIQTKPTVAVIYGERLIGDGTLSADEVKEMRTAYAEEFSRLEKDRRPGARGDACPTHGKITSHVGSTAVEKSRLQEIAKLLITYPDDFKPHPKLLKILEKRVESIDTGEGIDWGFAEGLSFGSLLQEGVSVRLSGEDCGRGTFSHRHLALSDYEKPGRYLPLSALDGKVDSARFEVINSVLSEAGVMGFEFGYGSIADRTLVIWEGQFGDFANGAQVIIDQFIASSEAKWGQRSGIVLMLPHGFEGQGPEHSSARLERYLQLAAEGNMSVCYPSRASQHFHLLRRQALSTVKRPLIIMTPKSLLRHPGAACTVKELTDGSFAPVLSEDRGAAKSISSVVMMSGKVYFDVRALLEKQKISGVRLTRVEELYPYPEKEIAKLAKGLTAKKLIWVQEEPKNMGAWSYIREKIRDSFAIEPIYVGRAEGASPATGSGKSHARELETMMKELSGLLTD